MHAFAMVREAMAFLDRTLPLSGHFIEGRIERRRFRIQRMRQQRVARLTKSRYMIDIYSQKHTENQKL